MCIIKIDLFCLIPIINLWALLSKIKAVLIKKLTPFGAKFDPNTALKKVIMVPFLNYIFLNYIGYYYYLLIRQSQPTRQI